MELVESTEVLQTGDGPIGIAVARPAGERPDLPALVLLHHGPGLDEATRQAMRLLADQGFFVVCSDRYHRLGLFTSFAMHRPDGSPDPEVMAAARAAILGTSDAMVARDLAQVVGFLDRDPHASSTRLGLVGYCVGARSMLFAMADQPQRFVAGVGFHPSFCVDVPTSPDAPPPGILGAPAPVGRVPDIAGRVLLLLGTADQLSSVEANAPLVAAVQGLDGRGEVSLVEGGDHGFALPGPAWTAASQVAYDRAVAFLGGALTP